MGIKIKQKKEMIPFKPGASFTFKYLSELKKGEEKKSTERTRRYRRKFPYKYRYQTLKDNARRRGKEFTLSYYDFLALIKDFDFDMNRDITIDRIDPLRGYESGNVQVLSRRDNILKQHHEDKEKVNIETIKAPF